MYSAYREQKRRKKFNLSKILNLDWRMILFIGIFAFVIFSLFRNQDPKIKATTEDLSGKLTFHGDIVFSLDINTREKSDIMKTLLDNIDTSLYKNIGPYPKLAFSIDTKTQCVTIATKVDNPNKIYQYLASSLQMTNGSFRYGSGNDMLSASLKQLDKYLYLEASAGLKSCPHELNRQYVDNTKSLITDKKTIAKFIYRQDLGTMNGTLKFEKRGLKLSGLLESRFLSDFKNIKFNNYVSRALNQDAFVYGEFNNMTQNTAKSIVNNKFLSSLFLYSGIDTNLFSRILKDSSVYFGLSPSSYIFNVKFPEKTEDYIASISKDLIETAKLFEMSKAIKIVREDIMTEVTQEDGLTIETLDKFKKDFDLISPPERLTWQVRNSINGYLKADFSNNILVQDRLSDLYRFDQAWKSDAGLFQLFFDFSNFKKFVINQINKYDRDSYLGLHCEKELPKNATLSKITNTGELALLSGTVIPFTGTVINLTSSGDLLLRDVILQSGSSLYKSRVPMICKINSLDWLDKLGVFTMRTFVGDKSLNLEMNLIN